MRPAITRTDFIFKAGTSGLSHQRGEALEGNLLVPPAHHALFLIEGPGR